VSRFNDWTPETVRVIPPEDQAADYLSQCAVCKHVERNGTEPGMRCSAFPDEIPERITRNKVDHRKPVKGDHGIQFEAAEDFEHPFAE
jgi:hypothetical protein